MACGVSISAGVIVGAITGSISGSLGTAVAVTFALTIIGMLIFVLYEFLNWRYGEHNLRLPKVRKAAGKVNAALDAVKEALTKVTTMVLPEEDEPFKFEDDDDEELLVPREYEEKIPS